MGQIVIFQRQRFTQRGFCHRFKVFAAFIVPFVIAGICQPYLAAGQVSQGSGPALDEAAGQGFQVDQGAFKISYHCGVGYRLFIEVAVERQLRDQDIAVMQGALDVLSDG